MSLFQNARLRAVALTALAVGLCAPFAAHAQTTNDVENTLVTFDGNNGRLPESGLILASDGNYYGTTYDGGAYGYGSVYKLIPTGSPITSFTLVTVYSFTATGGQNPMGGLIQGTDGNLYGTTYSDSVNASGTIFQLTLGGTLTTLHTFTGSSVTPADGKHPEASLIEGTDGYLYGTTHGGSGVELITNGEIFKIAKTGTGYTILHSCTTGTTLDCNSPVQPLVQGTNGSFYGMSYSGGANSLGDVFKITSTGTYTELNSFTSALSSPQTPYGGLVVGTDGTTLYGVTYAGGADSDGTFFSFVDNGTTGIATLQYSFAGKSNAGKPQAGLILGSDGNFYGTSIAAGGNSDGTVWTSSKIGVESMLYPFDFPTVPTDGQFPIANPIIGTDGYLYGTASAGGDYAYGVVWQVVPAAVLPKPITISLSSASITLGGTTTLSYSSPLAYGATMSQCFASSLDSEWAGIKTIKTTTTTLSLHPTTAGTYIYTITCGGTQSASVTLSVAGAAKTNTTTVYSATPNPVVIGNNLTLSATVTGTSGVPTGTVTFYLGSSSLISAPLVNGTGSVTFSTTGLPAAAFPLYAVYSGDTNNNASASATVTTTLTADSTATVLTVSPNPVSATGTTTFTANVSRTNQGVTGVPTGNVGFYFGTNQLISAAVNSQGVASVTVPVTGVAAGTYNITAEYLGDSSDSTSTSTAVPVTVN